MRRTLQRQRCAKAQQGMTLIEVVIALVLFALIALALVSGMTTMGQTLTKSTQRIDQINDM
ncbi:MAG: PulJ/GspJ family protein, partial [Halothiobacillus sp.]